MAKPIETEKVIPPMSRDAVVEPSSLNEAERTVDVVWTTGARVLRGYFDQFYEELSLDPKHVRMERLNSGNTPFLDSHDASTHSTIGVVTSARLQKGRGVATVRFLKRGVDEVADKVFQKIQDGILRNISVGYRTYKAEKVEGGDTTIPVFRAIDWEPYELSVVPMGADAGAGFRAAAAQPNPCVFGAPGAASQPNQNQSVLEARQEQTMPDDPKTTADPTEQLVEAAKAQRDKERKAEQGAAQDSAERAAVAERERVAEIISLIRRTDLGDDLAQKLITAGTPIDKVRVLVLDAIAERSAGLAPSGPDFRFAAGEDKRDKFLRGALASILERTGHTHTIVEAKKVPRLAHHLQGVATDPGEFRGMRMADLARHSLDLGGRSSKGLHGEDLIRRALQFRSDGGFNTTSDFAVLLETAVNKIFMGQYALTPVTWPMWCGRKVVQDFRTSTFYRPGTFGVLDTLTEAGEIKHKNIPDGEKRTLTPGTKANIIGITRRALANDDLGAFQNLASGLGMAAAFTVEADAFAMVTANSGLGSSYDANPLFHSSRTNIGPTGAMSVATLDGARAVMAKQKDPSANQFLALRPAVWLGPVELGGAAKQFNTSTTDPTDNKAQGVGNKVLNLFREIVDSPYLSASSSTRHYLLADPNLYPVFAVGFIDGQEAPRIESEQSFGFDGVQMKVILDYGTAVLDFRGAVTCAGS